MKKKLLAFLLLGVLAFSTAYSQVNRTITGKVVGSDDGLPLPGVSVRVQGGTTGTITGADGNYSLAVSSDAKTLVFSYIGYSEQSVAIGSSNRMNVTLKVDAQQLTEVIVTAGYGVGQKRDVGSASVRINAKQIENLPIQSFDRALQGRASGVQVTSQSGQPGGAINVRVRGVGSLNAGNDPLYIIDGVQVKTAAISGQGSTNTLASINPNDIESIEVLKDAAAASIYGAAAANGVVLVTTKKGKSGATQMTFSVQQGVMQNISRYDVMDANQYAAFKVPGAVNAGSTQAAAILAFGDPAANIPSTNWFDAITREGKSKIYDLSISGGDAKTNFFVSGSFTDQDAQVIEAFYKRGTFRGNLGHKVNDKFNINANIALTASKIFGTISDGAFVNGPFYYPFTLRPDVPIYQPDGSYTQGAALKAGFAYNIVQGAKEEVRLGNALQTVSNFSATYKLTPSLSITGFSGIDFVDTRDDNQRPATIPAFAGNGGTSSVVNTRILDWNSNVAANYNKVLGVHTFGALVGAEYKEQNSESASATGQGFPNPLFRSLQNGTPLSIAGFFTGYKKAGIFSRLNYDFNNKYYVSGTLRYDGSSRFGLDQQYGLFGGISGTWRVTGEKFMENVGVLSDLKLRASYGVVGNDQIADFASRALFGGGGSYLGSTGIRPSQLGNSQLGWEQAATTNLGLDFGLFKNRITGSFDVYRRINSDLLLSRPLVSDSGFGSINENSGKVQNEGIEIGLASNNISTRGGFVWNTDFNISFQRNKVLELINGQDRIGNTFIVGEPSDIIYTYKWAGVNPADGRPMWYDANGNYTYNLVAATDQGIQGSRYAKFYGGLNNAVSYKNFSLDFLFQYQYGNDAFVSFFQNIWNSGYNDDNQLASQLTEQWTTPGQVTAVPRALRNTPHPNNANALSAPITTASSRYLYDASYIRLKNITFGYQLPTKLASKIKMRSVRLFATGVNVLTFTDFPGLDPEVPIGFNEIGNNPQARTYTGGLQIGF